MLASVMSVSGEMAALIAVIMGLIEVVKQLIGRLISKSKPSETFEAKDREKLNYLYHAHNVKDDDGVPLWYVPRSWATSQAEVLKVLTQQTHILDMVSRTLDRLEKVKQNHAN